MRCFSKIYVGSADHILQFLQPSSLLQTHFTLCLIEVRADGGWSFSFAGHYLW